MTTNNCNQPTKPGLTAVPESAPETDRERDERRLALLLDNVFVSQASLVAIDALLKGLVEYRLRHHRSTLYRHVCARMLAGALLAYADEEHAKHRLAGSRAHGLTPEPPASVPRMEDRGHDRASTCDVTTTSRPADSPSTRGGHPGYHDEETE